MVKSNPIPVRWVTHKLVTVIPRKFSHCCEGSELHIRLPNLGSGKGTENPKGF